MRPSHSFRKPRRHWTSHCWRWNRKPISKARPCHAWNRHCKMLGSKGVKLPRRCISDAPRRYGTSSNAESRMRTRRSGRFSPNWRLRTLHCWRCSSASSNCSMTCNPPPLACRPNRRTAANATVKSWTNRLTKPACLRSA